MNQLAPCPNCDRHVRVHESECPFCEAPLRNLVARPLPRVRLTRAATFAFATTAAATACSGTTDSPQRAVSDATADTNASGGTGGAPVGYGGIGGAYGMGPGTVGGTGGLPVADANNGDAASGQGAAAAVDAADDAPDSGTSAGGIGGAYGAGPGTPGGTGGA